MSSRIRKKRPNEKSLPKHLQIPESFLYTKLQNLEKQIDTVLIRKRLDIQEALSKAVKQTQIFRIQIGNLFDGEAWTLQVEGRLLGEGKGTFSTFFKNAIVEIPETGETVEWLRNQHECDGFEIKRQGQSPIECKIILQQESSPEKFKLSPLLASLLGLHTETKSVVIMSVWQYIKNNKLQDGTDFRVVHCDEALKKVLGVQEFSFPQLPELLATHMSRADPIIVNYQIRTDVDRAQNSFVIDCEVEVEDPIRSQMMKFILNTSGQKEYAQLDMTIQKLIQQIHVHKLKKDFMSAFCKNPAEFLEKWIEAQSRDLEIVLGENQVNAEWQRRSIFYKEAWVPDAILHYLASRG